MHRGDAIPDFCVNDGTKIDVIVAEDDIRDSMVRNSFAKSSVDAKVGGGYAGIGIGLATGTNTQLQNGGSDEHKRSAQKMIGQYKLPRATLFLAPDDLVATPQLSEQVKKIRRHGSPADIRKFHRTFGEFFSHEVTVGGMLTSTKTWEANERSTQERSKDDFKQTIGLAISSPVDVGVDAKRESMGSTDDSYSRGYRDNSEQVVFEAIGGNTILASSPQLWCQTVSDFANWRAIERTGLQSILESITQCDTMELRGAAKWFSNAISSERMSVSIDVPASGDLFAQIRFRTKTSDNRDQYLVYRFEDPVSITIMDQPVGPERFQGPKIKPYDRCTWTDSTTGIWTIKHRGDGNSRDLHKVRLFMQMFKLEDGNCLASLFRQPNFRPETLTITIRYSDWWYWESDTPLRMSEDWLGKFDAPKGLRVLRVEYETLSRKKEEMMKIVRRNKGWKLAATRDMGHLSADGTELLEWKWNASLALTGVTASPTTEPTTPATTSPPCLPPNSMCGVEAQWRGTFFGRKEGLANPQQCLEFCNADRTWGECKSFSFDEAGVCWIHNKPASEITNPKAGSDYWIWDKECWECGEPGPVDQVPTRTTSATTAVETCLSPTAKCEVEAVFTPDEGVTSWGTYTGTPGTENVQEALIDRHDGAVSDSYDLEDIRTTPADKA
ncbi:hypothetical protein CkaCkLH20_01852 [Colletotrichum karsti]|uniref:Apple domain-containing protein n=1 Tax=Colletotrichum karsti TaxID=1095194 RepID=A0A9P6IJ20_9PEZI|nr:uncharacterized protein CkaCkLH20_01852 [Colletotrichum karsti]KAF9880810.1 hypothetical protein CkaCkLH20_01852 [Colletotrichum karsti]